MKKLTQNILSWCPDVEESALEQAINVSRHPCIIGNMCLMPDAHMGYGMPIGGVVALDGAISPNMVGVDIGCGMISLKTPLKRGDISHQIIKRAFSEIKSKIPVGKNHHKEPIHQMLFEYWLQKLKSTTGRICSENVKDIVFQVGTLGGGNHFLEIQYDEEENIWITLHSGSRNLGYRVANYYNNVAEELCLKWKHYKVVEDKLSFLPIDSQEGVDYIEDMKFCLDFAHINREVMMGISCQALFGEDGFNCHKVHIHHNYVTLENHYGKNVWVHRKGAVCAREGIYGVIPGSQGTETYITMGLGKKSSLNSCSHGAGRKMSRKKAVESLNLQDELDFLNNQEILHSIRHKNDLEEATSAYKDINEVMDNQKDLVKIIHKLKPLAVIKE